MSLIPVPAGAAQVVPAVPLMGPVGLRDELELWRETFEFAKLIAATPFAPGAYKGDPHAAMACILKGHELGVSALHALASIYVIDQRPCVAAELQRALIQSRGHELHIEESTSEKCTIWGRRRGAEKGTRVTFTMADARRARLDGKPNWQRYPADMLVARATGRVARFEFADVLAGLSHNYEELTDELLPFQAPQLEAPPPAEESKRTRRARPRSDDAGAASPAASDEPSAGQRRVTAPAPGPQERPPAPGGPPPPLPGEETEPAPQSPATDPRPQPPPPAAERPRGAQRAPDPADLPESDSEPTTGAPDQEVIERAQRIAMHAREVGVDHHHVVAAVTEGRTGSAKQLTAAECAQVHSALNEIGHGRLEVRPPAESQSAALRPPEGYQERIQQLREQQQTQRRGGQQQLPRPPEEGS